MKNRKKKLGALAISFAMLVVFGASAVTADEAVTVTWIVPGDTTFSITWAGAESEIVFDTGDRNFTGTGARSQTDVIPIINITNTGNTVVNYHMMFNASLPTGVTYANVSVYDISNDTLFSWSNANASTTNHTVASAIAVDGYADFWFFSNGVEAVESTEGGDLKLLYITSENV